MRNTVICLLAVGLIGSANLWAEAGTDAQPATQVAKVDDDDVKKLPPVTSSDNNHNANSLSSTLERGMDNQGLTMEEKWSDDVIVCKKQAISGSRIKKKVCHSRGEWRAIRENGRELTREIQRRDAGEQ